MCYNFSFHDSKIYFVHDLQVTFRRKTFFGLQYLLEWCLYREHFFVKRCLFETFQQNKTKVDSIFDRWRGKNQTGLHEMFTLFDIQFT